jgi:uncharacterized protein (TIGR02391 family)
LADAEDFLSCAVEMNPAAIRASVIPEGRSLLDDIWRRHVESQFRDDGWPTTREVHIERGKEKVQRILPELPSGSVITDNGMPPRYRLSLLGLFLTTEGPNYERVLVKYLDYLADAARNDPKITAIEGIDATQAIGLRPDRAPLMGRLVGMAGLWGPQFSPGPTWSCGVPDDLDDLVARNDFSNYLWNKALRTAERAVPAPQAQQRGINLGAQRLVADRRAAITGLHETIIVRSGPQFTDGHFEDAVLAAFKAVEERLRERVASPTLYGLDLVTAALNPRDGKLVLSSIAAEQEAAQLLFRGAIGFFKNPRSHRFVEVQDERVALELLGFASLLLRTIDTAKVRRKRRA